MRAGYLRECAAATKAPAAELHRSLPANAGVTGVQVFAILSPALLKRHPDPAAELRTLVAILDTQQRGQKLAADDDLVFWDHLCCDVHDSEAAAGMFRMFTHYRVQCIVLAERFGAEESVFERLETMTYLTLSTFCQRLVNAGDAAVHEKLRLDMLMDLPNLLQGLRTDNDGGVRQCASLLDKLLPLLTPVRHDAEGFRVFIEEANIAWIPYPYVKELAKNAGPFPRRQDLVQSRLIIGEVPSGRKVVVSHGWDTAFHISPSGVKMSHILDEMERIGATADDDAVFVDVRAGLCSECVWPPSQLNSTSRVVVIRRLRSFAVCLKSPLSACPTNILRTTSSRATSTWVVRRWSSASSLSRLQRCLACTRTMRCR